MNPFGFNMTTGLKGFLDNRTLTRGEQNLPVHYVMIGKAIIY